MLFSLYFFLFKFQFYFEKYKKKDVILSYFILLKNKQQLSFYTIFLSLLDLLIVIRGTSPPLAMFLTKYMFLHTHHGLFVHLGEVETRSW